MPFALPAARRARMYLSVLDDLEAISRDEGNRAAGDNPFLALERTGCVGADTGGEPRHVVLHALLGAVPLYRKRHSYGEYVFDWAWADAYRRNEHAPFRRFASPLSKR